MTFEYIHSYDHPSLDTPPQLAGLMGLQEGLGVAPIVVGGVAMTAGAFAAWLAKSGWSTGDYNNFMAMMNDVIHQWDKLGWKTGCWKKHPAKRVEWKKFWTRFGKHYGAHGKVSTYSFLSDAEEGPARVFMQEMQNWAKFFEKTCKADIGITAGGLDPEGGEAPPGDTGGMGDLVKWGAIGIGALVLLNVVTGLKGVVPRRP